MRLSNNSSIALYSPRLLYADRFLALRNAKIVFLTDSGYAYGTLKGNPRKTCMRADAFHKDTHISRLV